MYPLPFNQDAPAWQEWRILFNRTCQPSARKKECAEPRFGALWPHEVDVTFAQTPRPQFNYDDNVQF